jgi:predicted aspartyl protease
MPGYDASSFDPPAPVATVTLRGPSGSTSVSGVRLLIDTGADVTLIPRSAITALGIAPETGASYELIGFDGSRTAAEVVQLEVVFLNKVFRGRYLLSDDKDGILGRDVLNILRLLFDGPAQNWSEVSISG